MLVAFQRVAAESMAALQQVVVSEADPVRIVEKRNANSAWIVHAPETRLAWPL